MQTQVLSIREAEQFSQSHTAFSVCKREMREQMNEFLAGALETLKVQEVTCIWDLEQWLFTAQMIQAGMSCNVSLRESPGGGVLVTHPDCNAQCQVWDQGR